MISYVNEFDVALNPPTYQEGQVFVDANWPMGVRDSVSKYRWLREHYEPVARVGYGHLLFEVRPRQRE